MIASILTQHRFTHHQDPQQTDSVGEIDPSILIRIATCKWKLQPEDSHNGGRIDCDSAGSYYQGLGETEITREQLITVADLRFRQRIANQRVLQDGHFMTQIGRQQMGAHEIDHNSLSHPCPGEDDDVAEVS